MKTASCREWDGMNPNRQRPNDIIYLYERHHDERRPNERRTKSGRRKRNGDIFWNVFFTVMCLSVLVILFLH